ncbi:MAG: endonuclease III domain-containing protein [Alkalispirochaetaceae bacterium]
MSPDAEGELRVIAGHLDKNLETAVMAVAGERRDPFSILVSTIISLRTKDEVTFAASKRLLDLAGDPASMAALPEEEIAGAIYPAGFYRNKAKQIRESSRIIVEEHAGRTPDTLEALTALPGVGRKTANLVLGIGYGIPSICVDIHVHRIANRLGWIETRNPEQSEFALMELFPQRYWIPLNDLLVRFGQQQCTPVSPWCSSCPLEADCPKVGVGKRR